MIGDYAHHRVLGLSIRMKSGFWKEAAMRIDNLTLKNFRNFENAEIPLNPLTEYCDRQQRKRKKFSAYGCIDRRQHFLPWN